MVAVDAAEYLEPLSERDIAEAVTRYPCAVAIRGDAVIGMAVTRDMVGAAGVLGELFTIVTHPRQRSRGLGAALLSRVEQMGFAAGWEAICLESSMAYGSRYKTSPAPFYLRHGWTLLAINESTIYMAKTQPGGPATILASV
jgi:GNAT superfamily N-acetyltransferase